MRDSIVVTKPVTFKIPEQIVTYVQTPSSFGDVRIPRDRPAGITSFADITDEQLAVFGRQNGFAGTNTLRGTRSTWTHEIDYQGGGGNDIGELTFRGLVVEERSVDDKGVVYGDVYEKWWQLDNGNGRYFVARDIANGKLRRMLVVAGDHFVYARARATDLPANVALRDFIAADAPHEQKLAALDCELSFGLVRLGSVPWQVVNSTLPWHEGKSVEALPDASWNVEVDTFSSEEHQLIFGSAPRR